MPSPRPTPPAVELGRRLVSMLSDAESDEAAAAAVLAELARDLASPLAVLWSFDAEAGLLHWRLDWTDEEGHAELRQVISRLTFAPGVGLLGRVLASGEPGWSQDIAADADFARKELVLRAGLQSDVAVPLTTRDGVLGVMEFFGRDRAAPTRDQLERLNLASAQLAIYLMHQRAEDRLHASEEASASIVEAALDCIITMDHRGRIVDFNPAAEATFGHARSEAIGEPLGDLIIPPDLRAAHRRALEAYVRDRAPSILGKRLEMVGLRADGSIFPIELTVTRLGTREPPVFAGFIRDITERREAEERLGRMLEREQAERARARQAERAAREVAQALQHSLLPPRLPAIAGLELGAAYHSGTEGWEVGGDFYDVFKLALGRWAVAIGDVCGKGPQAAALTGRVRYALRLAAVRERSPSAVLATVNAELLADGPSDFLTAVFATIDVRDGSPLIRLAVGGHPLPLLAGPDGVAPVGRTGPLLGALDDIALHDVEFRLDGRSLLLYTDGLTEARSPGGRFGEARLAALVAGTAGLRPAELVERVASAVLDFRDGQAGDDIALLAIAGAPDPRR